MIIVEEIKLLLSLEDLQKLLGYSDADASPVVTSIRTKNPSTDDKTALVVTLKRVTAKGE